MRMVKGYYSTSSQADGYLNFRINLVRSQILLFLPNMQKVKGRASVCPLNHCDRYDSFSKSVLQS